MKKGELRKKEILNTAEALFCKKGYEQTSIQDIIDLLNSSKGSFYHHFVSKEALLEGICMNRAKQNYELSVSKMDDSWNSVECLNYLLSNMLPLRDERISFLLMLLPLFRKAEGRTVRAYYSSALSSQFREIVIRQIAYGCEKGEMSCQEYDYTADIILLMTNNLWVCICEIISASEEDGKETDISELLRMTDAYRTAVTRILSLPYGMIEIADLNMLKDLCIKIHQHWSVEK